MTPAKLLAAITLTLLGLTLAGLAALATKPTAAHLLRGLDMEGDGDA